jgi:hypothetical protein
MSTFKGVDLFGSGPHRFIEGPSGQQMILRVALGTPASGSVSLGDQEQVVTVRGRLVADEDSLLWDQIEDIKAHLLLWNTPGALEDHHGYTWMSINFVRFKPGDRVDRGRRVSLEYEATFIKL